MADEDAMPSTDAEAISGPRNGLAEQLRQLEAYVANTEQAGGPLPAEAMEMIVRLREIVFALDGLTSSISPDDLAARMANPGTHE